MRLGDRFTSSFAVKLLFITRLDHCFRSFILTQTTYLLILSIYCAKTSLDFDQLD